MDVMEVIVAGAGGMAREACGWALDAYPDAQVVGFVAASDTPAGTTMLRRPVWAELVQALGDSPSRPIVLGVGSPEIRRRIIMEADELNVELLTVVHPAAFVGGDVLIGRGSIVCPNATLTRGIQVGVGAIVNYSAAIGHDCQIGDRAFVGPGSTLGGGVLVEPDAYVGLGASVLPGRRIGRAATVGAGAVVTRDVPAGATVVGVPARSR